jgi:hypothetical protein
MGVKTLPWPGNSPDLNPIENLWMCIKYRLRKNNVTTLKSLKEIIEKIWYEDLPIENLKTLVDSMPNRIKEVIKSKGAATKY